MKGQSFNIYLRGKLTEADTTVRACFNCKHGDICKIWGNTRLMDSFERFLTDMRKLGLGVIF